MKKIMILSVVAIAATLTSCTVSTRTASQGMVSTTLAAAVVSDLEVSNTKISYTYSPTKSVRKGGKQNCINVAISEALATHGGADVLIETQEATIEKVKGGKVLRVTVTGYPAKYKNFKPVDEGTVKQGIVNGAFQKNSVVQKRSSGILKRGKAQF